MNLTDYNKAYEENKDIQDYVDRYCRKHRTTTEVALKHKIVQDKIELEYEVNKNVRH